MTTQEMKDVLAAKLREEGTYFTKKHISIRQIKNGYKVVIKDYEHIPFTIIMEEDDYFGKIVYVKNEWSESTIIWKDSKHEYLLFEALLSLGYYIGNRF